MVRFRPIQAKLDDFSMDLEVLENSITKDIERGLIPFFVHATSGTTSVVSFDNLAEIAKISKKYNLWFHIDAAYGGTAMLCPEFRHFFKGVEHADSINVNMHKMLLLSATLSVLW